MRAHSAVLVLALAAGGAQADVSESAAQLEFFAPGSAWRVTLPRQDWELLQEKRRPDGTGFYYFAASRAQGLQFSIYLDKTGKCSSGETCRAAFWRNGKPGPMYGDPQSARQYERNGFHVVEFYLDGVGGTPIKQSNVSAHMYRDGYWIDLRVTKVGREVPDLAPLGAFLDSVRVR